ncbi:hypothetical protein JTB14_006715 [Gonioctena quinquepunctata]|nr:hypothetical protein JTB14_006715 [Gonioctena quinquepunctata]
MHDRIFTDPETKKPEIIIYYNANKGGVDSLDEKCAKSTSSRHTRRWPLAIFFRILDVSVLNLYILHQCYKNNEVIKEKAEFAKELAAKLVKGNMERRLQNPRVPCELRLTISRILGRPEENVPVTQRSTSSDDKYPKLRESTPYLPNLKRRSRALGGGRLVDSSIKHWDKFFGELETSKAPFSNPFHPHSPNATVKFYTDKEDWKEPAPSYGAYPRTIGRPL